MVLWGEHREISEILRLVSGRVTRAEPQTSCKNNSGTERRAWADAMFVCWYIPGVCFIFPALSPCSLSSRGAGRVGWARIAVVWVVV